MNFTSKVHNPLEHFPLKHSMKLYLIILETLRYLILKWGISCRGVRPATVGHMQPRMAVSAAQHKTINLLKTL